MAYSVESKEDMMKMTIFFLRDWYHYKMEKLVTMTWEELQKAIGDEMGKDLEFCDELTDLDIIHWSDNEEEETQLV